MIFAPTLGFVLESQRAAAGFHLCAVPLDGAALESVKMSDGVFYQFYL
jgi:hypothetical protein